MHIVLIHQAFATLGEPGGTRHHEFSRYLAVQGHRVTVITGQVSYLTGRRTASGWVQREGEEAGVSILRCYTYPAWHRSFFHRLLSFLSFMLSSFIVGLSVRDIDLVWGTSPPIFQGLTAWMLARLKRTRFLFEVRDLWPHFAVAVGVLRNPLLIRLSEWLERFLYRSADGVIVNSPGFIEHVSMRGARTVELVPNGVDLSMFDVEEMEEAFRKENDLVEKFVVLYAGAHGMSNDLEVMLEAADQMREMEEIVFLFIGDGKEKQALMAKAQAMGLRNVRFMPPVPKTEMPKVLAAADVCVAILKPIEAYKTTYPNKVFDYMAAGRPVVLAIDGVIRSVVEEARAGLFVQPGSPESMSQAIRKLAEDRDLGQRMGRAGRDYVAEHFNRPVIAMRLEGMMEEMVGRDQGRGGDV